MIKIIALSGQPIYTADTSSFKEAVEFAIRDKAKLFGVNFIECDFGNADLQGEAFLYSCFKNAKIDNFKGYHNSLSIFIEIIKRQQSKYFTDVEWAAIGKIIALDLCYKSQRKHAADVESIYKKIADLGWPEFFEQYLKQCK